MTDDELPLDSGTITPDSYDDANQCAWHVFNVNFVGDENRSRVLKFVLARVRHFQKHLPSGSTQAVRFDLRGQAVSDRHLFDARTSLVQDAAIQGIQLSVDFLTG